jgi:hypothetical protein
MWLWEGIEELWVVHLEIGLPELSQNCPRRLSSKSRRGMQRIT